MLAEAAMADRTGLEIYAQVGRKIVGRIVHAIPRSESRIRRCDTPSRNPELPQLRVCRALARWTVHAVRRRAVRAAAVARAIAQSIMVAAAVAGPMQISASAA